MKNHLLSSKPRRQRFRVFNGNIRDSEGATCWENDSVNKLCVMLNEDTSNEFASLIWEKFKSDSVPSIALSSAVGSQGRHLLFMREGEWEWYERSEWHFLLVTACLLGTPSQSSSPPARPQKNFIFSRITYSLLQTHYFS